MDKKKVILMAEECGMSGQYTKLAAIRFAAAILTEASKECHYAATNAVTKWQIDSCLKLRDRLMQMAKELVK
jgi:hypothetical protein